jgi:predicted Zn-dependent protease
MAGDVNRCGALAACYDRRSCRARRRRREEEPMSSPAERVERMRKFVDSRPDDAFPRYGLAMEYTKLGELEAARAEFEELKRRHPDYLPLYYQHGMVLLKLEQVPEAVRVWREGIAVSAEKGDLHTRGELEAAIAAFGA